MQTTQRTAEVVSDSPNPRRRRWWVAAAMATSVVSLVSCSDAQQREAERKAEEARKQAGEAVEKARDQAGEAAKEASKAAQKTASKLGAEAKDVALKGASAAAAVGSEAAVSAGKASEVAAIRAAGALRTGAIRAALLRDESLDVSDVDVNTEEPAKRVVLLGRVKTAAQKAAVERIAKEKAPGYTVENRLTVRG
jgi:colicin import membrane protein